MSSHNMSSHNMSSLNISSHNMSLLNSTRTRSSRGIVASASKTPATIPRLDRVRVEFSNDILCDEILSEDILCEDILCEDMGYALLLMFDGSQDGATPSRTM